MVEPVKERRILVVEDEIAIQQVLCFFLKHRGYVALGAKNGQEAIQALPEFKPHLVILDLLMQPVSGWEVLHWMRANHFLPHTPVLVVSALVHLSEQMHGFEEGAVEYITKPTQPSLIMERVRALLEMSTEQRSLLHHKRMVEQRRTLDRLSAAESDEFVY
jgi:DNA-binding response OmpR family regulator